MDNYVLEGSGVQNNNLDRLYIGNKSGHTARAYIKFNTMPAIPSGATISSATMTLHLTSGTSTAYTANAYKVTGGDWASDTITWANKPAASTLLQSNISHNNLTKYSFSCTSAVQSWYNGSTTGQNANYGIMLRYYDETVSDYNAVYSADYSVESKRPSITFTYEASTTSVDVDEGATRTLTPPNVSGTITWACNDTSIATVNSSGKVTGVKAGQTLVTASVGGVVQKTYTIFVTIPDSVRFIRYSGLYLTVDGGMVEGSTLTLQSKKPAGPAQYRQLWKIEYIGQHYYSIRSLYRADLALHADSNKNVDMISLDCSLSGESVPLSKRWTIDYSSSGYLFHYVGTGSLEMQPETDPPSTNTDVVVGYIPNTPHKWTFEQSPAVSNQLLLINTTNGLPSTNAVRYIFPDETVTIADMNFMVSYVNPGTASPRVYWIIDSGNTRTASVVKNSGNVSGVSEGKITVKAYVQPTGIDGTTYYSSAFTVKVIPPEGTYYIKNKQTGFHMGLFDTYPENYFVTDLNYSGSATQRWVFDYLGNGLYSIKSADSSLGYLGIEGNSTSAGANVVLKSSVTRWYIEKNNRGTFTFMPYNSTSNNLVMAVPTNADPLQQHTYTNNGDLRDGWVIYNKTPNYRATVSTYYDLGYPVYYGETEAEGAYLIDIYTQAVADRFMELLGLDITASVATYQRSDIDDCKGTIGASTIDSLCNHSSKHTDGDTLLSYVNQVTAGGNEHTSAFWTCHYITPFSSVGGFNNRNLSFEDVVLILERVENTNNRYQDSTGALMHELCHQFGAQDHYHELGEDNTCKHAEICSDCGTNPRPATCIMQQFRIDITEDTVLCDECKQEILAHLQSHDMIP
ncbi:MAG: DNRLRE domain-containing protein [Oscillospiraceae bacterium]|nr:DNRLRE domain-containing protein [Oscillospiraceae bacterium]